jgi:Rha family phage regulatory protein
MNELVYLKNEEAMTDSLSVAEMFKKNHSKVIRSIENLAGGIAKNGDTQHMFVKSWYKHPQNGERYTKYLMNRDGFSLLVMGFTGKKALEWKLKYIHAFNTMEKIIHEKSTASWIENRKEGKLTRREETDVIQKFVEYAKKQGSTHASMYYTNYSDLANKTVGITNRKEATTKQLRDLAFVEEAIMRIVSAGIENGKEYKQIYADCKKNIGVIKQSALLG